MASKNKNDLDAYIASQLISEGRVEEGLRIASQVLDSNPEHGPSLFVVAYGMLKGEKYGIAYNLLKRAVNMVPARPEVWNNLAMACIGMQRLDEAESHLRKALRLDGNHTPALNNSALVSVYNCDPERALTLANKSIALNPNQWDVRETKGYAHLMRHEWVEGWEGYEAMIGHSKHRPLKPPHPDCPYWDGRTGINLYLRGEQGVGDEISFASILDEAARYNNVTLECDGKLAGLFRRSFPNIEVHGTRHAGDRSWLNAKTFDAHCLIGTLARHYRQRDEDFPGKPYLVADPERRMQWRALLDALPGKKIGIAWTGGLKNTFRGRRSFNLEGLLPILQVPGVTWVSLQYQDPSAEIAEFEEKHGIKIHHWARGAESQDYDDQAALVSELDGVISVCTAIEHLCGALGVECWNLVPSKPRWFYGLTGNRIPWYGSVEMFRQADKWPVEKVAARLKEKVRETVAEAA